MQKDEEMNHRSKKSQCQATLRSLKLFIEGWRAFYDANGGAIPIECQAGRAAMGLPAEETRLVPIGEGEEELPLSFFLSSQLQMVVKFLCTSWNELVDSAALALVQLGKSHATTWATQMKKAAPVHLADLFFQEQLVETLQSRSVQRCVLRNLLPSGHGNAAEPHVAWTAVQLEILNNGWIHRIQKLDFPQMEEFRPARVESPASQKKMALSEEKQEEVLDKLARMQLAELQVSRDWVRWILPRLGSCEPSMKVLDHDDIQDELSGIPPATVEILDGVSIAVLPQLLQLLEEENGEFGHHLSPLLKEPAPLDLQQIFCEGWVRPSGIKAEEFQRRDAVLRETITNLEYEPFCEHATSHASTPLLEMYTMVYTPDETPLRGLPDQIRGCHLLAVLHSLRALLRDLRCRKAELDQGSVWDPQQGTVRALPLDLPLEVDKETPWWEAAPAAPDVSHAEMAGNLWNPNLDVLAFMCWACQDPLNGGDYLSQLCSDASVSKLLAACGFTAQESDRENCINRFLDSYEKQLTLSSAGHASTQRSSAAWQRSCSAELVPLPTLLAYKDVPDPEAMRQQLWHIAESKLSEDPVGFAARCVLPNLWRRFLDSYVAQCSSDLEEALRRVVDAANASMPRIVTVPTEAEDAAKSGEAIILKYRDEYFEVKSSAQSELAADDQWASRKAAQIQRVWRRCAKKASPPAAAAEPLTEAQASSEAAEAAEAAADPPQATAVIADAVEKSDGYPAVLSAAAAVAPVIPVEVSLESVEGASEMEEVRSVQSVLTWTSQMSRLASVASVPSAGDGGPSRWDRFLLDADHFLDLFPRSVPEVEGSFKQSFEAVITDGRALMKEIIIPMTQYLRKKHKKLPEGSLFQLFQSLTEDELLALVSYTYDLRKKYPKADGKLNFAAQVSVAVLNETEDPHMNVCVHHFKTAVEKCRSAQPRTLYCAVMPNCMEHLRQLQPDDEVLWPSYTSWTTNQDVALQAATAVCGAVVQLDAPRNVSDVSVFRSERREAFSEFILPVNTPLLVKMVAEHPPGDDGDDDSRVATALILEGVEGVDEDEWQHIDS